MSNTASGSLRNLDICRIRIRTMKINCRWRMSYTTLLKMQLGYWELMNPALADHDIERLNHTLWNRSVGSCFTYSVRTSVDFEIIYECYLIFLSAVPEDRGTMFCVFFQCLQTWYVYVVICMDCGILWMLSCNRTLYGVALQTVQNTSYRTVGNYSKLLVWKILFKAL